MGRYLLMDLWTSSRKVQGLQKSAIFPNRAVVTVVQYSYNLVDVCLSPYFGTLKKNIP